MTSLSDEFLTFAKQVGLREEHAEVLWKADIRTPHDIGALDVKTLKQLCNNPFLLNTIHPLLQEHVLDIATSNDSFKKALLLIKNPSRKQAPPVTTSDSSGSVQTTLGLESSGDSSNKSGSTPITNDVQSPSNDDKKKASTITIKGGDFNQVVIGAEGPVLFTNKNTTISSSSSARGEPIRPRDMEWTGGKDYSVKDNFHVEPSRKQLYEHYNKAAKVYQVRNFGQNRALIINNYEFSPDTRMNRRNGADADTRNMERILSQLGFQVACKRNKTADAMRQLLKEFAESENNREADMVAVFIGSHGERDDRGHDTFFGVNGGGVSLGDVKEMFSPECCPYLDDKPKIFFLQFCRETNIRPAAAFDTENDGSFDHRPMDFICAYATLAGNRAYRHREDGSWFVTCIVRVFSENANKEDLESMLTQVNNSVSSMEGQERGERALQISEIVHTLRRKIFFWPGMK